MTKIAGIVLRCKDRAGTAEFYKRLGLMTNEHQHGGPLHFEMGPVDDHFIAELYAGSEQFSRDALMLEVSDLTVSLELALKSGAVLKKDSKSGGDIRYAYVLDPDGRDLMLYQKA